jgi:two-component system, OmpR family, alkaline phosphatase synthesis response regulator PhoP
MFSNPHYTILFVDDTPELLRAVTFALERLGGYTVVTAPDGIRGLEQVNAIRPDCVVIDVKMPGLNGYQLTRALRGDPETADIPLIILSALVQPDDQKEGMDAGVDYYLTKPLDPYKLVQAIHYAIQQSEEDRIRRMSELFGELDD